MAGFPVGEGYNVPWANIDVSSTLTLQVFSFVEQALMSMHAQRPINYGVINFLELLQHLRPFFWRAVAAINVKFPSSPFIKSLKKDILNSDEARFFLSSWPAALKAKDDSD